MQNNNKLIVVYNNQEGLPFHLSSNLHQKGWKISIDRELMGQAEVVVFYLSTLKSLIPDELEKREGQIWVGWKRYTESYPKFMFESVWDDLFDLYISYSAQCYWKCATTFGTQLHSQRFVYPVLEEITDWLRKVDFMIVGTQKGGSTALHEYLQQHPSCWGSLFKEPGYFLYPVVHKRGLPWYMGEMWKECVPFYHSAMNNLLFESSTWYSYWHEIPQRLFEYNPCLKLIFLVRNPIDRAFSQYNMLIKWSKDKLMYEYSLYPDRVKISGLIDQLLDTDNYSFEYWVNIEIEKINKGLNFPSDFFPDFLHRGFYYEQLERYYHFFPKESILVLESSELKNDRIGMLNKIEEFLGIPANDWEKMDLRERFISRYTVSLDNELRRKLEVFFRSCNNKMYELVGRTFDWSS